MKRIFTFLLTASISSLGFSQGSMKIISKKTGADISGTVHRIYGDASKFTIKEEFKAVWEGSPMETVGIKRTELSIIAGTSEYLCWVICYSPMLAGVNPIWPAPDSLPMIENDTVGFFSVYLEPDSNLGEAKYRYTFTGETNPMDTTYVDIIFTMLTLEVDELNAVNLSVFPNPATDVLNVQLDSKTMDLVNYRLIGIDGKQQRLGQLNAGLNRLDVGDLVKGLYLIEILGKNEEVVRREKMLIK